MAWVSRAERSASHAHSQAPPPSDLLVLGVQVSEELGGQWQAQGLWTRLNQVLSPCQRMPRLILQVFRLHVH